MKKRVIIALAFSVCAFSFAQKKELKLVEKAIQSGNYSDAKEAIKQAEALMGAMDEKTKSKYYFLNGKVLYSNGLASSKEIELALESLDKVEGNYAEEAGEFKSTMIKELVNKGNSAYEKNDYSTASKYFENAYRASVKDTTYLYYAAATAINVPDYDRALGLYEELKTLSYTGISKQYYATDKETNEEELFDKTSRDLFVKSGTHINPGERMTESKKAEIVKNVALIYVSNGDNEKALQALKEARAENPDDINIVLSEANINYKMGNTEEFKNLLQKATEMDPTNAELQYNLGVIASDSDHLEEARAHYEKAVEIDPTYINAYINLSALVLSKEKSLIEEMNSLGNSKKDNLRYDELKEARQQIYRDAIPYLSKALEVKPDNIDAAKTLLNIYSILGETDKRKELQAKVDALEGGN